MCDKLTEARVFSQLDPTKLECEKRTLKAQIQIRNLTDWDKLSCMCLWNAPETFQTLMSKILNDCIDKCMAVYMEDFFGLIKAETDHLQKV